MALKVLLACASLLSLTPSAFASHAYGKDSCVAKTSSGKTLEYQFSNTGPNDPHRIDLSAYSPEELKAAGIGEDDTLWVNIGGGTDESASTAALVMKVKARPNYGERKIEDDKCFTGSTWNYGASANVTKSDSKVQKLLGIKKGDRLELSCYGEEQMPTGKEGC